ncbi:hypothetical protein BVG16_05765 [Paenibacillus selenitireducens]|uniref:DUF7305 domain-containing protein n=1 Tax=Paenibacillus selenitireducens TaxID=1324314 RepID=A0A1T2XKI7_9BACL|nr:hypothetical protein [Paenibacillus selenitireducens]OPA80246.1 hypothetical protein BVG16_05765 [Paenibacillus selenitireducens]
MIKNERGFALPMVLILVTALSILGMALLGVSVSQAARTVHQEKKEQAFYIAKSGADAVASYIIDHYNPVSVSTTDEIKNLNKGYLEQDISLGTGTFRANVTRGPDDTIVISSKGTLGKVTNQASLTLGMDEPVVTIDHAILASKDIVNTGETIVNNGGNIAAGGSISGDEIKLDGGSAESNYSGAFPPAIPFPDITGWITKTLVINASISESAYYGSYLSSDAVFEINMTNNKDMHIVFKKFEPATTVINVTGTGNGIIHLYMDNIKVAASFTINNLLSKKVILHVKDSIDLNGSFNLHGVLLYAPTAEYTSTNGSIDLKGAMVTKKVTLQGSNVINYDASIANLIKESRKFERKNWRNS